MMQDKKVTELSDSQFDVAVAEGLTLVDFWAPWCGPCIMQGPILEEVAESVDGQAKIAKVNVDDAGGVAGRFGVQSIPTLLLIKDGNEVRRFVGVQPKEILVEAIISAI
ncbi:MAG: thioredoxin [Desulfobacteraceae bacterium]|nr:thioredoxin [Desulfobacteraceae bacterium]